MKRLIAAAAIGLIAVALYAVTASGTPQAVTPKQFAALSAKVSALQKKLTSVSKELAAFESCVPTGAVGIAQFGNATTEGYVYQNPDKSLELQTALDRATDPAPAYMLVTNQQCANIINGGKKHPTSLGAVHR
jgi:hypothetical protein